MFCPKCGNQIYETGAFCPKCGYRFNEQRRAAPSYSQQGVNQANPYTEDSQGTTVLSEPPFPAPPAQPAKPPRPVNPPQVQVVQPKKKKKGGKAVAVTIILILIIAVIGAGGYFGYLKYSEYAFETARSDRTDNFEFEGESIIESVELDSRGRIDTAVLSEHNIEAEAGKVDYVAKVSYVPVYYTYDSDNGTVNFENMETYKRSVPKSIKENQITKDNEASCKGASGYSGVPNQGDIYHFYVEIYIVPDLKDSNAFNKFFNERIEGGFTPDKPNISREAFFVYDEGEMKPIFIEEMKKQFINSVWENDKLYHAKYDTERNKYTITDKVNPIKSR